VAFRRGKSAIRPAVSTNGQTVPLRLRVLLFDLTHLLAVLGACAPPAESRRDSVGYLGALKALAPQRFLGLYRN
jgi:hypothetical protein